MVAVFANLLTQNAANTSRRPPGRLETRAYTRQNSKFVPKGADLQNLCNNLWLDLQSEFHHLKISEMANKCTGCLPLDVSLWTGRPTFLLTTIVVNNASAKFHRDWIGLLTVWTCEAAKASKLSVPCTGLPSRTAVLLGVGATDVSDSAESDWNCDAH